MTVTVEEVGRRWVLTDGAGRNYQLTFDGQELLAYGWLTTSVEYECNAQGQHRLALVNPALGVNRPRHDHPADTSAL